MLPLLYQNPKGNTRGTEQAQAAGRSRKRLKAAGQHPLYLRWRAYQDSNGIAPRISLYELRHTFVSLAQDLPDGKLKPLVGHSRNMDTRGVYGHEITGALEDTAA